jgi:hypothetical protein
MTGPDLLTSQSCKYSACGKQTAEYCSECKEYEENLCPYSGLLESITEGEDGDCEQIDRRNGNVGDLPAIHIGEKYQATMRCKATNAA